jgi:hypothetical protein
MLSRVSAALLAAAALLSASSVRAPEVLGQGAGDGPSGAPATFDARAVVDRVLRSGAEDPAYLRALGVPVGVDGLPPPEAASGPAAERYLRAQTRDDLAALAAALRGGLGPRVHRPGIPTTSDDHCSRPFPSDPNPTVGGAGIDVPVRLLGFRPVSLLVRDGEAVCSAVIVGGRLAVTAAHCLDRAKDPRNLIEQPGNRCRTPRRATQVAVAPYGLEGSDAFELVHGGTGRRLGRPKSGRLIRATEVCAHPDWLSAGGNLDRDIALLRLEAPALPRGERAAELPTRVTPVPPPVEVTIAGYGGTSRDPWIGKEFRVGWQQLTEFDRVYTGLWHDAAGLSFACAGDSGGAVLAERLRGCPGERALLVGLMVHVGAGCSGLASRTGLSILALGADPVRSWIAEIRRRWGED